MALNTEEVGFEHFGLDTAGLIPMTDLCYVIHLIM